MIEEFIEYMKNGGVSKNTYLSYAKDVKLFQIYYKNSYGEELQELIHADISMYISYLLKHDTKPTTINRKLSALKMYNQFLIYKNIQNEIIIKAKDYIKIQDTLISKTIPTEKEINKLKHYSSRDKKHAKRDYCVIVLLVYGGVRASELVSIKISDINLENRYINIIGKGNKFRQIIINNLMYDGLKEYLEERKNMNTKSPYLFVGQKNKNTNEPLDRNFCNRLLNKYKKLCNIDNLHPHLLRAFYCSNALHNAGYTIEQVANQAGHSSLNTTKLYLHSKQEDLLSLANKL